MLGTRGVPASYSGFETCVEELGWRLVRRGQRVTVYCRTHHISYDRPTYRGMRLVKLPTLANKYFDTLLHSFLSSLHALGQGFDIGLYFIAGNSPVSWIPRLTGTRTILNVDGLDWKREKWPPAAKFYIKTAEYLATRLPNRFLTDSRAVQAYYEDRYGRRPPYIPYGSEVDPEPPGETLARFGLEPRRYILFVGRLVPENCAHHLVEAFRRLDTRMKCVIVGDAPYADDYIRRLRDSARDDGRIVFTGYLFGRGYRELGSSAEIFVETSGVGGTHPALLEAMALGNCVVVNGTQENLETIGDAGLSYSGAGGSDDLRRVLRQLLCDRDRIQVLRRLALDRARKRFQWESITDAYERLFYRLCRQPLPRRLQDSADELTP
jgi:glycosyltransferase involved in cell wall biosynthesis